MKTFKIILFIVLFLAAVAGALFFGFLPHKAKNAELVHQTAALSKTVVNVVTPKFAPSEQTFILPGDLQGREESDIYPRISGYIKAWNADLGAKVKQGDVLLEIDAPEIDSELTKAKANVAQAAAELAVAKITAERYQKLAGSALVTKQDVDLKTGALPVTEAKLKSMQAELARLEDMERFKKVLAPYDGVIVDRRVNLGQLVEPGPKSVLYRLYALDKLRLYIRVPQMISHSVKEGLAAEVHASELPDKVFPAKVVQVAGAIDSDTRTMQVELSVDNPNGLLLAGSHVEVRLKIPNESPALLLPATAFLFRSEGPQVGVVKTDGTVDLLNVKLGRDFGKEIEVVKGLNAKDRVINNPSDGLEKGDKVTLGKEG